MISRTVRDVMTVYYDEREYRTDLIQNTRRTMEQILKRLECAEKNSGVSEPPDDIVEAENVKVDEPEAPALEADNTEMEAGDFSAWLRSISQCLSNKISDDPVKVDDEEEVTEEEPEEESERCMSVVRSVFDEETATEVIKNYLWLLKETVLPDQARIVFKFCFFETDSGCITLK